MRRRHRGNGVHMVGLMGNILHSKSAQHQSVSKIIPIPGSVPASIILPPSLQNSHSNGKRSSSQNIIVPWTQVNCVICQEPLGKTNILIPKCGHVYCASCIFENFKYSTKCPLCRIPIIQNKFQHLDQTIASIIVQDKIRQTNISAIILQLFNLFNETNQTSHWANTSEHYKRRCVSDVIHILGTFGLDLCEYIQIIYDN